MNKTQRAILFATAFILIVMLLFPPFKMQFPTGFIANQGYSFILSPPMYDEYHKLPVDSILLLIQFLIVISVGGILFLALKSKQDAPT